MKVTRFVLSVSILLALSACTDTQVQSTTPMSTSSAQIAPTGVNQLELETRPDRQSKAVCWTPGDVPGLVIYFRATQGEGTVTAVVSQAGRVLRQGEMEAYWGMGDDGSRHIEIYDLSAFGPVDVELVGTDNSRIELKVDTLPRDSCSANPT